MKKKERAALDICLGGVNRVIFYKIVSWQCVGHESILLSRDYIMNGYSGKVSSSSIAKIFGWDLYTVVLFSLVQ